MNEGQDNANKAGGGSTAGSQGIFSTPELTVDAEKISQANTNTEQKRVASFFANTDAGQRSQKLNNAMGISSQPITEDLVIQNEPKKKSKLPIILAVVVLIAVVGGLVVAFLSLWKSNQEIISPLLAFEEYKSYLDRKPSQLQSDDTDFDDTSEAVNEWSIFELQDMRMQNSDHRQYTSELSEKYNYFLKVTEADKRSGATLINYAKEYQSLFLMVLVYNSLSVEKDVLARIYTKEGEQAAFQYADALVDPEAFRDSTLIQIATFLRDFMIDEQKLLTIYSQEGCLDDGTVDYVCATALENTNESFYNLLQHQIYIRNTLGAFVTILKNTFDEHTAILGDYVKEAYA